MKAIRKRLTYANVMSSIAVFLILGGATAVAAKKIGTKQLKANSVTTGKIKKNAVTTAKLKNGAVNGAKVKDASLTGSDIDLNTLGPVPTAKKTEQIAHVFFTANRGDPQQTILNLGGLTLRATCPGGGGDNEIVATTSVSHSVIDLVTAQDNDYDADIDFNVGETFDADNNHSQGDTEMYTVQYTRPDGVDVVVIYHDIDIGDGPAFPTTPQQRDCLVSGIAFVS